MKVLIINGSPKGNYSITLQTMLYIEKIFPENDYTLLNVGQQIRKFRNDMSEAVKELTSAQLVIFAYPVYTYLAPSQLHEFIHMLREAGLDMSGKYASQLTTSKHFYDYTAHKYLEENCLDMGFRFINGMSADMDDLLTEKGQADAVAFWKYLTYSVDNGLYFCGVKKNTGSVDTYKTRFDISPKLSDKKRAVIVTDAKEDEDSLNAMIEDFRAVFPYKTDIVNLNDFPFSGGCLGCFSCAVNGRCIYKDGFDEFLRTRIQTADAIILAFSIEEHSLGYLFKRYHDRQFCNGHRAVTMGKPMGYIVSGCLSAENNVRTVIEGRSEVGHNFLAGIVCDEGNTSEDIIKVSKSICYSMKNGYVPVRNFLGVGGQKIFRDLIYVMRGLMKADHEFFKEHGFYDDLPSRQFGTMAKIKLVGSLVSLPQVKSKMGNAMNEGMIMPYKKVIEKTGQKK